MKTKPILLLLTLALLLAACGTATPSAATPTLILPTIPTSFVPAATFTPLPPPTITATTVVVAGTLTFQVNVRSGPGVDYSLLGMLNAGETVQVTGQSGDGAWFQIFYSAGSGGIGWVSAQYVDTGGQPVPTLTPQGGSVSGPAGTVTQRLNVRSGPGTNYEALGILEVGATVSLTGKNETGAWMQIVYSGGPGGRGWVTAQYVQTDAAGLPVLNAFGTPVTPGSAGGTPAPGVTATPTVGPAMSDGDTSAMPLYSTLFSPLGTKSFERQGDVSIPDGDPEDWIEFTPYALPGGTTVSLTANLGCSGNGTLVVELWQNGAPLADWGTFACGDIGRSFLLPVGGAYQFRFRPAAGNGLQYVYYYLRMKNNP
ncbi:MAG: peptidase S9 family protein [Anaerolineaceae bacterium]|nr:MAG: peptidase S9 family protein [Anaerolineaceae bacterium]